METENLSKGTVNFTANTKDKLQFIECIIQFCSKVVLGKRMKIFANILFFQPYK